VKKILGLALAAFMVMGLVGGGTWAYFSDPESTTGNVFAAGTLDLEVDSANPWASAPINVTDLEPGTAMTPVTIDIDNAGNMIGDLYFRLTGVSNGGGTPLYPVGSEVCSSEPEYVAEGGPGSWVADDNLSDNLTLSLQKDIGAGNVAVTGYDGVNLDVAVANTGWTLIWDDMPASGSGDITLGVTLESVAQNEFQGDNSTFSIEFQLQQDGQGSP